MLAGQYAQLAQGMRWSNKSDKCRKYRSMCVDELRIGYSQ